MATYLVIGTVPAALVGLLLLDLIDSQLRSVEIIFFTTLFFGLLLGWADWRPNQHRDITTLTWRYALLVGAAQALSLIPGTSRSGVTITAGLMLGLSRKRRPAFRSCWPFPSPHWRRPPNCLKSLLVMWLWIGKAFSLGELRHLPWP